MMLGTALSPWPSFSDEEVAAVAATLRSNRVNYWTGEEGRAFEREFAAWAGSSYAVAVMNGTVALDLALHAIGAGPGDEIVVTPRSFIASASCVVNCGAVPVFADVDRNSGNISAETIAPVLTERTRAIVLVHLGGHPADMDPIMALARRRGIVVIEDCAQAHGARYRGRSVGSIGHIGAWSFCQDKIMTTGGEGGMVTVDDEGLWRAMWSYKDHGKNLAAIEAPAAGPGFRWVHDSFGTNWRMLEMQAVLGRIQLAKLGGWTGQRNRNAQAIRRTLEPLAGPGGPVRLPELARANPPDAGEDVHAYYRLYVYVRPDKLAPGWTRDRIAAEIQAEGIPCFQGACPEIYREKAFEDAALAPPQRLPAAMELGETSLAFLVHPTLTDAEIARTAEVAAEVFRRAVR
jgi:dTDP-4-amino-4,6-dideoxygalactose transaminase